MKSNFETSDCFKTGSLPRRDFLKIAASSAIGLTLTGTVFAQSGGRQRTPLGLDAWSVRGMRIKAPELISYAATLDVDVLVLNNIDLYFENLETSYLENLRRMADSHNLQLYIGTGSICKKSKSYNNKYGDPESLLAEGIRVAGILGSPVVNVLIGSLNDRYSEGGIEARIEEVIKVLKALRNRARDAGLRFACENHGGDLRSDELLSLVKEVGTDVCGVMLDPGNALTSMEDPMHHIQILGRHVLCTSVRDYMIWESENGATFQWTAIGEGLMDVPAYVKFMAELCPGAPLSIETISNEHRHIPFLTEDFLKGFPNLPVTEIVNFLKLIRRGHPLKIINPPPGVDRNEFEIELQKSELNKSLEYLRNGYICK